MKFDFLAEFKEPGFYIIFENGEKVSINKSSITSSKEIFKKETVNSEIKDAPKFKKCGFCLSQDKVICDAIGPIFPLIEILNKYDSFEKAILIWKHDEKDTFFSMFKDLQTALGQIALWSMTDYCYLSGKYSHYFDGIIPYMSREQISKIILKNIALSCSLIFEDTKKEVIRFAKLMQITTENRIRRVQFLSRTDAVANAYIKALVPIQLLEKNFDSMFNKLVVTGRPTGTQKKKFQEEFIFNENEHKEVYEHLKLLRSEAEKINNFDKVKEKALNLKEVLSQHFTHEQDFFKKTSYIHLQFHTNAHNLYLEGLNSFIETLNKKSRIEMLDYVNFLENWLSEHILELDSELEF